MAQQYIELGEYVRPNSYHQALTFDEADSTGSDVLDFAAYGMPASIVSGAVGIINTGTAFANMFGADLDKIDTEDTLQNFGWDTTAAYYSEHKDLVDAVGFGVTALVPGALGLKAAKATQLGLSTYSGTSRTMTGLRRALVPENQAAKLREGIIDDALSAPSKFSLTLQATKQGLHQAAVETAFIETAVMLTMNQNPTINDQNLSYLDSIVENSGGIGFSFVLGTGIGGAVNSIINRSNMQRIIEGTNMQINQLLKYSTPDMEKLSLNINQGDRAASLVHEIETVRFTAEGAAQTPLPSQVKTAGKRTLKKLDSDLQDTLAKLTGEYREKGNWANGGQLSKEVYNSLTRMGYKDSVNFLANAQHIGRYSDLEALFDPIMMDKYTDIVGEGKWIDAVQKRLFKENYAVGDPAQIQAVRTHFQGEYVTEIVEDGSTSIAIRDSIIEEGTDAELQAILRHELGTASADRLRQVLSHQKLEGLNTNLEAISKRVRPEAWARTDTTAILEQYAKAPKEQLESLAFQITQMNKDRAQLTNPDSLLADAWDYMHTEGNLLKAEKEFNDVFRMMLGNQQIKQRVGVSEALLDTRTGDMFRVPDRFPTAADAGPTSLRGNTIKVGDDSYSWTPMSFSVLDKSPAEASANYFAASTGKFRTGKELEINWDNFAVLNHFKHALAGDTPVKSVLKVKIDNVTRVFDFATDPNAGKSLDAMYGGLKKRALKEIRKQDPRRYSASELARIVDVDERYAEFSGATQAGEEFWSMVYHPSKPTVAKASYRNRTDVTNPDKMNTINDVEMRMAAAEESAITSVHAFMATIDETLGDMFVPSVVETGVNYMRSAHRYTNAARFASFANGNYDDALSFTQQVGKANEKLKVSGNSAIDTSLSAPYHAVKADKGAVMEAAVLDQKLRQDFYIFAPSKESMEDGSYIIGLRTLEDTDKFNANVQKLGPAIQSLQQFAKSGALITRGTEEALSRVLNSQRVSNQQVQRIQDMIANDGLQIKNSNLLQFWQTKVTMNDQYMVKGSRVIAGARGQEMNLDGRVLYPGKLDTARYKQEFIRYVTPKNGVWKGDHPAIVGGNSAEELAEKVARVKQVYGDDVYINSADEFSKQYQRSGLYDDALAITENTTNRSMKRHGVQWDLMPEPVPELFDHYMNDMKRQWSGIADNLTTIRYSREFSTLEEQSALAGVYEKTLRGKVSKDNPFEELMAIMLNKPAGESFTGWRTTQQNIDNMVSNVFDNLKVAVGSKRYEAGDYKEMDQMMQEYGVPRVYSDMVGQFLTERRGIDSQQLGSILPRANGIASTLMLRLDQAQAMVTAMSTPITAVPEIKHLLDTIPSLARQQATKNTSVRIPNTEYSMPNNGKLMYQAMKDFWKRPDKVKEYHDLGLTPSIVQEMRDVAESIALPADMVQGLKGWEKSKYKFSKGLDDAVDFVAKRVTMTDSAEHLAKFTAVRMADLTLEAAGITDKAIKQIAMRTYMNRVHGNYTYAQRPALFQGFGGQAIGLFQTYTFNLIQQLTRHIGDKQLGSVGAMMGLEAGIFGMQSVPGFRMLNQYIGERSEEGNDFYTYTEEAAGDEVSDWILYGLSSNFVKPVLNAFDIDDGIGLYTRGDLNPRTPFIIPTSIDEVPVYSLSTKFVGNILDSVGKITDGVSVPQVFAEALAQNGVNRPLAGVGELLAKGRVTGDGGLITGTDDLNWWQAMVRLTGAKSLNESVAVNSFYRAKSYDSYRREKLNTLGESVKTQVRAGNFSGEDYSATMKEYAVNGGKMDYFQRWMHDRAMAATESTLLGMYEKNDSASGRYLQNIMGGQIEQYVDVQY